MDSKRAFNQVKGFSLGLLATPAAFADQFTANETPYCSRLVAAIAEIPEAGKAGKAGMITSGVVAFVGALALFNHVASGPRIEDLAQPQAKKVEVQVPHRGVEGQIHPVRGDAAKLAPTYSSPR